MPDAILTILLTDDIADIAVLLHLLAVAVLFQQLADGCVLHIIFYVYACLTLRIDNLRLAALGKDNLLQECRIREVQLLQLRQTMQVYNLSSGGAHRESLEVGEVFQEVIVVDDIAASTPVQHEYRCSLCLSSINDAVAIGVDVLETIGEDAKLLH